MKQRLLHVLLCTVVLGLCSAQGYALSLTSDMVEVQDETDGYVHDIITIADLDKVTSTTYTGFQGKSFISDAVYDGMAAKESNSIRLKDNNHRIATSVSGGFVRRITVTWGKKSGYLVVYGQNVSYGSTDGVAYGQELGRITYNTVQTKTTLEIKGDYQYIYMCGSGSAVYISSIDVAWEPIDGIDYIDFSKYTGTTPDVVNSSNNASLTFSSNEADIAPQYKKNNTTMTNSSVNVAELSTDNSMLIHSEEPIYKIKISYTNGTNISDEELNVAEGIAFSTEKNTAVWLIPGLKDITYINKGNKAVQIISVTLYHNGYTRTVTPYNYGTICLPKTVKATDYDGATFYSIAGTIKDTEGQVKGLELKETTDNLVAGCPYFFKANKTILTASYSGVATTEAKTDNGLVGNINETSISVPVNGNCGVLNGGKIYILSDYATATVGQYRAYIDLSQIKESNDVKSVRLYFDGTEEATSVNNVVSETNMRNKHIYDVQGHIINTLRPGINIVNGSKILIR